MIVKSSDSGTNEKRIWILFMLLQSVSLRAKFLYVLGPQLQIKDSNSTNKRSPED